MTVWVEGTNPSTTWAGASVEPGRRYGIGRYGVRAYGQGGTRGSQAFTENTVAASTFVES